MSHDLFDPIIKLFEENGAQYNLINSAIIDLFNFLVQNDKFTLIEHCVTKYRHIMQEITYVDTFRKLITKHEAHQEFLASEHTQHPKSRYVIAASLALALRTVLIHSLS